MKSLFQITPNCSSHETKKRTEVVLSHYDVRFHFLVSLPTLSAVRRRGYTPESIRDFCDKIGVAKRENLIDVGLLEFCVREHLNKISNRRMVVFEPLKVVITNYPEGKTEMVETENNPEDQSAGKREMPFSREVYIEQEDFMEVPPKKFFPPGPRADGSIEERLYHPL